MEEEFAEYLVSASENLLLEYGQTADQNDVKKLKDLVMVRLHAQYLGNVGDLQHCVSLKICDLSGNFLTSIDRLEGCTNLIKLDLHNNQIEDLPSAVFWKNMKNLRLLYLHDNPVSKLDSVHSLSFCPTLTALTLSNTPLSLKVAYRHIVVNSIFSLKALDYYIISDEEIMEDWRLPEKFRPFTPMFFVDYRPHSSKERTFQEEIKMVREIISKINHIQSHYSPVLIIQRWIRGYLIRKILCIIPMRHVLQHNRLIAEKTKRIYDGLTDSTYERKSAKYPIIQPEEHREVTSRNQLIDIKDIEELHIYLRRLQLPLLSVILELEEKQKVKPKESRRSPMKDLLDLKITEDEMATGFRLSGCRMPFYSVSDELQEYTRKEKIFFDDAHDRLHHFVRPVPETMPVHRPICIEKRIFARAFGTIRLRPLHAIDKAYWESHLCDIQINKERKVMRMQIAGAAAEEYGRRLFKEKREIIHRKHVESNLMVNDIMKENMRKREMDFVYNRKKFAQFLENKENKATERSYVQVFSSQHTSLTRGLLQLDGWRKREEGISKKKTAIKENVEEKKYRKDAYKSYRAQRITMLQKRNASEKIFRKCLNEGLTRERFQKSRQRAKAAKTPTVKIPCPLPIIGSSGIARSIKDYYG